MGQVLVKNKQTGKVEWVERSQADLLPGRNSQLAQTYTEVRPFISESAGVHPSQVDEFNEFIRELGLQASLRYLPDGRLRCTSRSALNVFLQERGMFNADGGYGDHTGK